MNATPISLPNRVFPFKSVSQRLNLQYDEIDANLDRLFVELFDERTSPSASVPCAAALAPLVIHL